MNPVTAYESLLQGPHPLLALAPMQDVTDLAFWRVLTRYGGVDLYYTEYFRVHAVSRLEKHILPGIVENPTGRPVVAQLIGNDIPALVRAARELQQYPVAAIDLNLGCPAPVVYRKCAGGGLLRDLPRVRAILEALREVVRIKLTVKTRLGFASPDEFLALLEVLRQARLDLVVVHGRTVRESFQTPACYGPIRQAVRALPCPVVANGDVFTWKDGLEVLRLTGARGLMIGRGAIRNPWIFQQLRQSWQGEPVHIPTGREVLAYLRFLYQMTRPPGLAETKQVKKMKLYLRHLAPGVDGSGQFLHRVLRVDNEAGFFQVCETFLDHNGPAYEAKASG